MVGVEKYTLELVVMWYGAGETLWERNLLEVAVKMGSLQGDFQNDFSPFAPLARTLL